MKLLQFFRYFGLFLAPCLFFENIVAAPAYWEYFKKGLHWTPEGKDYKTDLRAIFWVEHRFSLGLGGLQKRAFLTNKILDEALSEDKTTNISVAVKILDGNFGSGSIIKKLQDRHSQKAMVSGVMSGCIDRYREVMTGQPRQQHPYLQSQEGIEWEKNRYEYLDFYEKTKKDVESLKKASQSEKEAFFKDMFKKYCDAIDFILHLDDDFEKDEQAVAEWNEYKSQFDDQVSSSAQSAPEEGPKNNEPSDPKPELQRSSWPWWWLLVVVGGVGTIWFANRLLHKNVLDRAARKHKDKKELQEEVLGEELA